MIDLKSKIRFEGQFDNEFPMGWGYLYYPNGDIYLGEVQKFER
jgi:hypothetical protein